MSEGTTHRGTGEAALEVEIIRAGESALLRVEGELDLASADKLERELEAVEADAPPLLVVDLRELAFMDSSGLRLLLVSAERAREGERRLVVVHGSPEIDRVLEITGVDRQLELAAEPPEPF